MADVTATTGEKTGKTPTQKEKTGSKKKGFMKGVKSEFKKVTWPDRTTVLKESGSVIVLTVILGLIISVIDAALELGLGFLMGL